MTDSSGSRPDRWQQALRYRPPAGVYDEFLDVNGSVRPRWEHLLDGPPTETGAEADDSGHWPLDAFPYIADAREWRHLEAGLLQRARLLNAIVADFYGAQRLVRQQGLPPALLFANPAYLPQCRGQPTPGDRLLHLLAFDLGRAPDGQWRVLANHAEAPTGLGLALQNRIDTRRCLPELPDNGHVATLEEFRRRVAGYIRSGKIRGGKTDAPGSSAVILSGDERQPGRTDCDYLGRHLGLPVVEGADLTARAGQVLLKTPGGLQPVDTIIRALNSLACDPLELATGSLRGTPGLLAAAAAGQVAVLNAIGSGVVQSPALAGFLPGLCETLLEESLRLPDLATWWCGQPREADHVAARLDTLQLFRAFDRQPAIDTDVDAGLLPAPLDMHGEILEQELALRPYDYVGRQPLLLSTMPCWHEPGRLLPAPLTIRLFVAATEQGYRLMPGGLARVATSRGTLSKDIRVVDGNGQVHGTRPSGTPHS